MEELIKIDENIRNKIYIIRGKQVMLDRDLANLYHTETRIFMQSVKRNIERFPERFMFQLTDEEFKYWRSQFVMSKNDKMGLRRPPYVFTEHGVAMLAGILRSDIAVNASIRIIDSFVAMRKYISVGFLNQEYISNMVFNHEDRLKTLEKTFSSFNEKNNHIFFKGQIYDAYSLMVDILNKSKKEIIVIDNYIDKNILDILSKINKIIIIITNKYNNEDYDKYKKQYNNIKLIINNDFHDRFIILDREILYHCGSSFKDLGEKCFEISKIEEKDILDSLLSKIDVK